MLIFNSRKFWSKAEQGESIQNGGVSVCYHTNSQLSNVTFNHALSY